MQNVPSAGEGEFESVRENTHVIEDEPTSWEIEQYNFAAPTLAAVRQVSVNE